MDAPKVLMNVKIYHLSGEDIFEVNDIVYTTSAYSALFDFVNNGNASALNAINPIQILLNSVSESSENQLYYKEVLSDFLEMKFVEIPAYSKRQGLYRVEWFSHKHPDAINKASHPFERKLALIDNHYVQVFSPKTCEEIPYYFISLMLTNNTFYQKCKLCGNFFIPEPRNVEYCERFYKDTGKRCSEIGAQVIFKERRQKDEIGRLYDILYRRFVGRVQRGTVSRSTFDVWAKKAKEAKRQASQGEITFEEYKAILEDFEN